jgi:large subunit ribosomal protein L28
MVALVYNQYHKQGKQSPDTMKRCSITGKGTQYGKNVSFSKRRTRRTWEPNLQRKTLTINGVKTKVKISANGIRTLKKKGLLGYNNLDT